MSSIPKEKLEEIIKILKERGAVRSCPRCGKEKFTLTDGYFADVLQTDLNIFRVTGSSVPSIAVICDNCGYISQHALGALGLLPQEVKKE